MLFQIIKIIAFKVIFCVISAYKQTIERNIDKTRMDRDASRQKLPDSTYDYWIFNSTTLLDFEMKIDDVIADILFFNN